MAAVHVSIVCESCARLHAITHHRRAYQTAPPATAPTTSNGVGASGMKRRRQRRAACHESRHERRTGQPASPAANPPQ